MSRRKQYTRNRKYKNNKIKGTMKRRYSATQLGGVTKRKYDPINKKFTTEGEVDSDDEDLGDGDKDTKSLDDNYSDTETEDTRSNQYDSDIGSIPDKENNTFTDNQYDSDSELSGRSADSETSNKYVDSEYDSDNPENEEDVNNKEEPDEEDVNNKEELDEENVNNNEELDEENVNNNEELDEENLNNKEELDEEDVNNKEEPDEENVNNKEELDEENVKQKNVNNNEKPKNNVIDLTDESSSIIKEEPLSDVNVEAPIIKEEPLSDVKVEAPIIKEEPLSDVNVKKDHTLTNTFNSDNLKVEFIQLTDEYWNKIKNDNPKEYMKNIIDCIENFKQNNNDETLQLLQLTIKTNKTINDKKHADNAINGVIIIYRIENNSIINILLMYETIINIPYHKKFNETLKKILYAISEKTKIDNFEFNLINPSDNVITLLHYLKREYNDKKNANNNKYIFKDIYTNDNNTYSRYNI